MPKQKTIVRLDTVNAEEVDSNTSEANLNLNSTPSSGKKKKRKQQRIANAPSNSFSANVVGPVDVDSTEEIQQSVAVPYKIPKKSDLSTSNGPSNASNSFKPIEHNEEDDFVDYDEEVPVEVDDTNKEVPTFLSDSESDGEHRPIDQNTIKELLGLDFVPSNQLNLNKVVSTFSVLRKHGLFAGNGIRLCKEINFALFPRHRDSRFIVKQKVALHSLMLLLKQYPNSFEWAISYLDEHYNSDLQFGE